MRVVEIPKRSGEYRRIYVPSRGEMARLRALVGEIADKAAKACPRGVAHGFVRRRSPVTNAMAHVGHAWTVTMDLASFFDAVTASKLKGLLPAGTIDQITVDGACRQGLPTSPAAANLAASKLDRAILKWIAKRKLQVVYTRYADDLAFSGDDRGIIPLLLAEIPRIASRCGWKVRPDKTHIYDSRGGRRIITGVAVDDGIHPTRAAKRRLRAALHQGGLPQAAGLREWCRLKPPRQPQMGLLGDADVRDEVRRLGRVWRLGPVYADKLPQKSPDEDLGEGGIVTGDPVMMLGMSTYTTGWTSCTRQPTGQYRRGTVFLMHLRGARIAACLSDHTAVYGGVERPKMRARAIVYELRDGRKVYERIYGNAPYTEVLERRLRAAGYRKCSSVKRGVKVVGHAPSGWRVWLDNMHSITSTASKGRWRGRKVRIITT